MRGLSTTHLEFDEIWGFIGKKEKHVRPEDDPTLGDVWTFCAIDADTKLVPTFKVGKRDSDDGECLCIRCGYDGSRIAYRFLVMHYMPMWSRRASLWR